MFVLYFEIRTFLVQYFKKNGDVIKGNFILKSKIRRNNDTIMKKGAKYLENVAQAKLFQ